MNPPRRHWDGLRGPCVGVGKLTIIACCAFMSTATPRLASYQTTMQNDVQVALIAGKVSSTQTRRPIIGARVELVGVPHPRRTACQARSLTPTARKRAWWLWRATIRRHGNRKVTTFGPFRSATANSDSRGFPRADTLPSTNHRDALSSSKRPSTCTWFGHGRRGCNCPSKARSGWISELDKVEQVRTFTLQRAAAQSRS